MVDCQYLMVALISFYNTDLSWSLRKMSMTKVLYWTEVIIRTKKYSQSDREMERDSTNERER